MPLSSVNYSGGIIITDWYSENSSPNESLKISIRFLTNEIRSDALDVKIFTRKCLENFMNCKVMETDRILMNELKKEILKKAYIYEQEKKDENFKIIARSDAKSVEEVSVMKIINGSNSPSSLKENLTKVQTPLVKIIDLLGRETR